VSGLEIRCRAPSAAAAAAGILSPMNSEVFSYAGGTQSTMNLDVKTTCKFRTGWQPTPHADRQIDRQTDRQATSTQASGKHAKYSPNHTMKDTPTCVT
jgi:hypothetical protein